MRVAVKHCLILLFIQIQVFFLCVACVPHSEQQADPISTDTSIVEDAASEDSDIHSALSGTIKIGVTISAFDYNTMTDVRNGIQSYFIMASTDDVEFEVKILDGKRDADEQLRHVDSFIAENYDVLIVDPIDVSLADIITEKAKTADIPVVYLHYRADKEVIITWDKTCFVGFDNRQSGLVQGEIVANLPNNGDVNGDGIVSYVMITGNPEFAETQNRTEYFIKALTDRGIEVEELIRRDGNWEEDQGYDIAATAISQFGDRIDVIYCTNDPMAVGASRAISEAGRTVNKDIYLVGCDALFFAVDMVNSGQMTGTVLADNDARAVAASEAAIRFVQGNGNEKYIWVDYIPIVAEIG